jgi:transketolase
MQCRFINAGVAEQNMISVAAGLAKTGICVWVYSIAPFCYARPFEQIRNDVCFHHLPVHLVGNGGGYGYGVMGATHHALEDYGVLLTLPGMRAYVPAFASDLDALVAKIQDSDHPTYLRLGKNELPAGLSAPPYGPWRRLIEGAGPLLVVVGALAGGLLEALRDLDEFVRPELWAVTELPLRPEAIPAAFVMSLKSAPALWVLEEHVAQGSFGQMLATWILQESLPIPEFGSQAFHRVESGIDASSIRQAILVRAQSVSRS